MSVNYIPLESKSGFRSPGFLVNELGDLTVDGNVQFNSQLNVAPDFTVNGVLVIDNSDSVVSLGSSIRNSNLSRLGTLEFLNIEGDLRISEGSTPYFNVVNGHVEITSVSATGSINNMDIGLYQPGDGNFKSLNVGPGDSSGELTVQGNIYTTGTVDIATAPTETSHATRKDYVDARISAFAIAFGA
jgi:hypothetical protein